VSKSPLRPGRNICSAVSFGLQGVVTPRPIYNQFRLAIIIEIVISIGYIRVLLHPLDEDKIYNKNVILNVSLVIFKINKY
jgi:hypothetical protein